MLHHSSVPMCSHAVALGERQARLAVSDHLVCRLIIPPLPLCLRRGALRLAGLVGHAHAARLDHCARRLRTHGGTGAHPRSLSWLLARDPSSLQTRDWQLSDGVDLGARSHHPPYRTSRPRNLSPNRKRRKVSALGRRRKSSTPLRTHPLTRPEALNAAP